VRLGTAIADGDVSSTNLLSAEVDGRRWISPRGTAPWGRFQASALIGAILRMATYTTSHVSNVQTGLDCSNRVVERRYAGPVVMMGRLVPLTR
jgi:hypothetical protein